VAVALDQGGSLWAIHSPIVSDPGRSSSCDLDRGLRGCRSPVACPAARRAWTRSAPSWRSSQLRTSSLKTGRYDSSVVLARLLRRHPGGRAGTARAAVSVCAAVVVLAGCGGSPA